MRIEQLTFTRFLAAMTVVFFHYGQNIPVLNIYPWNRILLGASTWVSYFFTLSGFIMAIAYYELEPRRPFNSRKYAVARIARIYPLYFAGLALAVPTIMYVGNNGKKALLLNLTMLQAWIPGYPLTFNTPAWSVSVEAFFYFSLPFLLLLLARRSPRLLLITAGVVWIISQAVHLYGLNFHYGGYPSASHDILYYNPLLHFNAFLVGLVAGMLFKRYKERINLQPRAVLIGLVGSFILICLCLIYWSDVAARLGFVAVTTNGALAPLFSIFLVFLSLDQSAVSRFMQLRIPVLLGEASYALYLLQEPLSRYYFYDFVPRVAWGDSTHFLVFVTGLILVSVLVLNFYEKPARAWIRKKGRPFTTS